jgi:hypothetical protein
MLVTGVIDPGITEFGMELALLNAYLVWFG